MGVDGIGECLDDTAQEVGPVHFAGLVAELDVGELGHPVDGQEHVELALGEAQLGDVEMHVSDGGFGELAPFCGLVWVIGQPGDAVPLEAAMQA